MGAHVSKKKYLLASLNIDELSKGYTCYGLWSILDYLGHILLYPVHNVNARMVSFSSSSSSSCVKRH
eukprot:8209137-Ditylum_brightwellii.AAC.1